MSKSARIIQYVGAIMCICGFSFPYFIGAGTIPPMGYDVLQIGGLAALIIGTIAVRATTTKSKGGQA